MDDSDDALAQVECGFDRIGDAAAALLVHGHAVGDDRHVVFAAVVYCRRCVNIVGGSVYSNADEALLLKPSEEVGVLDLDGHFLRRGEQQFGSGWQRHDAVDDFVGGLLRHGHVARRAVRLAEPREHDSQVVVDFGDGADGGTWCAADGFLFDGDRG